MFIGPCTIVIADEQKPTRCHLLLSFSFLETQHVSGINISIFRSLRLCCWTTTLAHTFLVCCVNYQIGSYILGLLCELPDWLIRSWFVVWTTRLAHTFLVCCVLEFGYGSSRLVSGLPAERMSHCGSSQQTKNVWTIMAYHTTNQEYMSHCGSSHNKPRTYEPLWQFTQQTKNVWAIMAVHTTNQERMSLCGSSHNKPRIYEPMW